jgi:hypothetical protein
MRDFEAYAGEARSSVYVRLGTQTVGCSVEHDTHLTD